MIIYSDDPRGIKQAMAEELEKNPNAQIHLKKAKNKPVQGVIVEGGCSSESLPEIAEEFYAPDAISLPNIKKKKTSNKPVEGDE